MSNYTAELKYISNEDYELPSHLLEFEVSANGISDAITSVAHKLRYKMLNENDYEVIDIGDDYAEISFGDGETGQDVCYSIAIA